MSYIRKPGQPSCKIYNQHFFPHEDVLELVRSQGNFTCTGVGVVTAAAALDVVEVVPIDEVVVGGIVVSIVVSIVVGPLGIGAVRVVGVPGTATQ